MKKFRGIIAVALIIVLGLGVYTYSMNKTTQEKISISEVEKLASRNLETDYPNTPKKVIEYYSQIMKCFYGAELDDDTLKKLVEQTRKLYDKDLLAENPEEEAFNNIKDYIKEYQKQNKRITEYIIEDSKNIEHYTKEDASYAIVPVQYFVRDKSSTSKVEEDYLLRREEDGNWKILGWELRQQIPQKEE